MLTTWARRWALVTVAVPVAAWALDKGADLLEQRRGRSDVTDGMHGVAERVRGLGGRRGRAR